jgi:hypothetical protein
MGRKRTYEDEYHRKLRDKVARHRAKHRVKLAQRELQRATERGRQKGGRAAQWRLYERAEPLGETADVLLSQAEQAPDGYAVSPWLPSMPIAWRLAITLAAARRRQIRESLTR